MVRQPVDDDAGPVDDDAVDVPVRVPGRVLEQGQDLPGLGLVHGDLEGPRHLGGGPPVPGGARGKGTEGREREDGLGEGGHDGDVLPGGADVDALQVHVRGAVEVDPGDLEVEDPKVLEDDGGGPSRGVNAVVGGEAEGAVADDAALRGAHGGPKRGRALAVVERRGREFDEGVEALGKGVALRLGQGEAVQVDDDVRGLDRDRGEEAELVWRKRVQERRPVVGRGVEDDVFLKHVPPRFSNPVGPRREVGLPQGRFREPREGLLDGPGGLPGLLGRVRGGGGLDSPGQRRDGRVQGVGGASTNHA